MKCRLHINGCCSFFQKEYKLFRNETKHSYRLPVNKFENIFFPGMAFLQKQSLTYQLNILYKGSPTFYMENQESTEWANMFGWDLWFQKLRFQFFFPFISVADECETKKQTNQNPWTSECCSVTDLIS